jgi:hypothetical protein
MTAGANVATSCSVLTDGSHGIGEPAALEPPALDDVKPILSIEKIVLCAWTERLESFILSYIGRRVSLSSVYCCERRSQLSRFTQTVRATLPDGGFNCALMLRREFSLDGLALVEMLRSSLM